MSERKAALLQRETIAFEQQTESLKRELIMWVLCFWMLGFFECRLNRLQEKHKQMKMDEALSNSDNVKVEPKQQKQLDSQTDDLKNNE